MINAAKQEVLAKCKPDFIDENGTKKLVFRDEAGNIISNVKNNMNPFSVKELVLDTSIKDIIDTTEKRTGGGTTGNQGGNQGGRGSMMFDFSGCKTQVEATKIIEQGLMAEGLTRDSKEFQDKLSEAYAENNINELPIR